MPLAILSNVSVHSIHRVIENSGLARFDHLISVEEVQVFKPHTSVYELAEKKLSLRRSQIIFASSNASDASGAHHFGYPVFWVNRSNNTFEELGRTPTHIVTGVDELPELIRLRIGSLMHLA